MWARRISIDDLNAAIKSGTSYTGAGQLDSKSGTAILRPQGQLETPDQYLDLIIGGTSQCAGLSARRGDGRRFGSGRAREYAVLGAWLFSAVSDRHRWRSIVAPAPMPWKCLKASTKSCRRSANELPGSIRITPIYDRSLTIVHSVSDVRMTLIIAFVLVVMVIFAFLGRATDTLIPTVALRYRCLSRSSRCVRLDTASTTCR